jgi:DNA-binding GntR family transcriptional regulator
MGDFEQGGMSAQREAYQLLRARILAGTYSGGMRINPTTVAQELGISRQPVREALRQLDSEGLIVMKPNRSAVVTELTPSEIEEVFAIRAALEGLMAGRAALRLTADTFDELEVILHRMDRASEDRELWLKRHNEFHDFLSHQAGALRLSAEIQRIQATVEPYIALYVSVFLNPEMPGYEHRELLEALKTGRPETAEAAMKKHVLSAGEAIIQFLRAREDAA